MNIGPVFLAGRTILAPLAGITDAPFRRLAKAAGCALVYSEMIGSHGLFYQSEKTEAMLRATPEEAPFTVQIFGGNPAIMGRAAVKVQASGAHMIDINFGCSVKKILKSGAGAALMKDLSLAADVIQAVRDAVSIPLTIKMRSGWTPDGSDAFRLAEIAEARGVNAVALHPRTATQGFGGRADWSLIAALKQRTGLPVIGNGDIVRPEDARRMLDQTGCDAVMVGRAAIGAPWIFKQINACLAGEPVLEPSLEHRFEVMSDYINAMVEHYGEALACRVMRSRLGWFTRAMPHGTLFRESIKRIETKDRIMAVVSDYRESLAAGGFLP